MHKSYKDLETITQSEIEERKRICIDPIMRPSYLNSLKMADFIKKMALIQQSADTLNAFELKFLKDPLPRIEESKDANVTQMIPDTVTLGQLGQKKQHQTYKGKGAELLPPVIVEEGEEVSLGSFDMKQYTVNPNQITNGK